MTTGEVIALIKAFGGGGGGSSGGGVLVVHGTTVDNVTTLDKTWQEIVDAGFSVLHTYDSESDFTYIDPIGGYMVDRESPDMPLYHVFYSGGDYSASSTDGYPDNGDHGR